MGRPATNTDAYLRCYERTNVGRILCTSTNSSLRISLKLKLSNDHMYRKNIVQNYAVDDILRNLRNLR